MQGSSTGYADMAEGRVPVAETLVEVDLPGGIYPDLTLAASNIEIQASNTSSLPSQVGLAGGQPSMTADFTLSGMVDPTDASKTAAWLFRRYNTDSPLWRTDAMQSPVRISAGGYPEGCAGVPELIRQFTGYVDDYECNTDGSVTFHCIDGWTRLRKLPGAVASVLPPEYSTGLTAEAGLEMAIRQASNGEISQSPPPLDDCLLSVGFHTTLTAEVGHFEGFFGLGVDGQGFRFVDGVHGRAVRADGPDGFQPRYTTGDDITFSNSHTTRIHVEGFSKNLSVATSDKPFGVIFGGDEAEKDFEARMEAEGKKIEAEALKLCHRLPALLASQQTLSASIPAFKPYATMTQSDIDDCGKDVKGKGVAVTSS